MPSILDVIYCTAASFNPIPVALNSLNSQTPTFWVLFFLSFTVCIACINSCITLSDNSKISIFLSIYIEELSCKKTTP